MITVALPNSVEWFVAFAACWKIGAVPQPVSAKLPARELQAILELADPSVVIGVPPGAGRWTPDAAHRLPGPIPTCPMTLSPMSISPAWKAPTSGGSTGRPKLIVSGDPALCDPDAPPLFGKADGCMVVPAPLYHNGPIVWSCTAWLAGSHVVVLPRFDAEATLEAIDRYRGRHRVPGAHHDEADLAAARRGTRLLRPLLPRVRVASGRALSALAEGGLDRLARGGPDLRALRRHRGTGGDHHHRGPNGSPIVVRSAGRRRAPS